MISSIDVSASLSVLYILTTNVKWFSVYTHKTIGLFKKKFLIYIILTTRKRSVFSISSLFKFRTSYCRPSITEQTDIQKSSKLPKPEVLQLFDSSSSMSAGIYNVFKLQTFSKK